MDLSRGYVGFDQIWEARPLSRIMRIPTDGGPAVCVHEASSWVGHVNASPKLPAVLTFCREGSWYTVDHRIRSLDISSGAAKMLRPRTGAEMVGHEY